MSLIKEFCTENVEDIELAILAGANRIELCASLDVGGVTPAYEVIKKAVSICSPYSVPVMVIIRPRKGNFIYCEAEISQMLLDINKCRELGANGVVFGALTASNEIDENVTELLCKTSEGLSRTFHMAFDHITKEKQLSSISLLISYGFDRILTHGSSESNSIECNLLRLKSYIHHANNQIIIMPGGGITYNNLQVIATALDVSEIHGTRIVNIEKSGESMQVNNIR